MKRFGRLPRYYPEYANRLLLWRRNRKRASVEFRLVHPESYEQLALLRFSGGYTAPPEGWTVMQRLHSNSYLDHYLVENKVQINESSVARAVVECMRVKSIRLTFTSTGERLWADIAKANPDRQLAIIVNGKLLMAPTITEGMTGKTVSISTFLHTEQELRMLARSLKRH